MARAGFGGSGDYSSTFAGLYSANKDTQRAQQDADDQDAFDKWQNGLLSDDEWMTYIRGRIDTYSGDPKRQERWVTNLRKYAVVISDNQAEFAYKNGGSINQLIAYYQGRADSMVPGSTEARDLQLRINDLQDTRSSDSITEGGEKIIAGINKGTKTYGDLQSFLQAQLKTARPNSDLFKSINKQLDNVKEQIRTNVLEGSFEKLQYEYDAGKLSGGGYAAKLRQMAVQFKDSDPKRYYQILEAAIAIGKQGSSGGRGGRGGGGGGGGSAASRKSLNATVDSIQAARNRTQALIEQFDNLGPGRSGVDPVTGKPVVFNEAKIKELDQALVRQFDDLAAAYTAKGDKSAAANAQKAKASYISQNVMAHNTMSADDSTRALLVSTGKVLDYATANPDPTAALGSVQGVAKVWKDYASSLEKSAVKTAGYGGDKNRRLPSESGETQYAGKLGIMDQVSSDRLDRAKAMADAFATIARPGVSDEEVTAAAQLVMQYDSGVDAPGGSKPVYSQMIAAATKVAGNSQGLATDDVQRVVQGGQVTFVRTQAVTTYATVDGSTMPVTKKIPMIDGLDGENARLVDIFMDINGVPTKVQAVATRSGVDGFNAWVASSPIKIGKGGQATSYPAGTPLTQDVIKKLQATGQWDAYLTAGTVGRAPALEMMTVQSAAFTDKYGKAHPAETWVQDLGTNLWYKGNLPVRGAIPGEDGTIPYKLGPDGKPIADLNWQSYGSAGGVPAPYSGANPREMQNLMNQDSDLVADIRGRGPDGSVTDEPQGLQWAYYDPMNASPMNADSWWKDEQRDARKAALVDRDRKLIQTQKKHQDDLMRANMDPDEYRDWKKNSQSKAIVDAGRSFLETSGINAIARSLGISIDGTKDRKPFQPTLPSAGKLKDDLALGLPKKKGDSAAPLVRLPSDTSKTYTGPKTKDDVVLTLPATQKTVSVPHAGKEKDDLALPTKKPTPTPVIKLPPVPKVGTTGATKKQAGGNYAS